MTGAQNTLRHRGIAQRLLSCGPGVFPGEGGADEESAKKCVDQVVAIIGDALASGWVIHLEGVGTISVLPGRTGRRVLGGVVEEGATDRLRLRIRTALAMSNRLNPERPRRKKAPGQNSKGRG